MELLRPYGLLALAALPLVLLGWLYLVQRRQRQAEVFGAPAFRLTQVVRELVVVGLIAAFAALAAAEPAVIGNAPATERTDAEAYVVVDISRSMLARPSRHAPSRFATATMTAKEIRPQLPDVPFGIAALTDRALPLLPPTVDESVFDTVLDTTLWVGNPPPSTTNSGIATTLVSLGDIPHLSFFQPSSTKKLLILFSDLESQTFDVNLVAQAMRHYGVGLILVQTRGPNDHIYLKGGKIESYYQLDEHRANFAQIKRLAAETSGGRIYQASDTKGIVAAAKRYLGSGPEKQIGETEQFLVLSPFFLAAILPLLALLLLPKLSLRSLWRR